MTTLTQGYWTATRILLGGGSAAGIAEGASIVNDDTHPLAGRVYRLYWIAPNAIDAVCLNSKNHYELDTLPPAEAQKWIKLFTALQQAGVTKTEGVSLTLA